MSRLCSVCSSPSALKIDRALFAGEAVAAVAQRFEIGESSVRRHARAHITRTILRELRASPTVGSVDLLESLVEALSDVSAVRNAAILSGQSALVLRAAGATESLVRTLSEALTPDGDLDLVRQLRAGENLARAVGHVVRADPAIAALLADRLRELDDHETATGLERFAESIPTKGLAS